MSQYIRFTRQVFLCAAALSLTCAPSQAGPLDVDLLKHARFVADTDDWHGRRFHEGIEVQWVTDDVLVHTRSFGEKDERRVAFRLNLKTGRETRLPYLTRALNSFSHEIIDSRGISPDGKWFLWSNRWGNTLVTEVNGPHHYESLNQDSGDNYKTVFWLPDSRHWLENFNVNGKTHWLVLHDVKKPNAATMLPTGSRSGVLTSVDRIISLKRAIAVVDRGHTFERTADRHIVHVYQLDLTNEHDTRQIATLHVPRGLDYLCTVSPRGDRIAFPLKIRNPKGGYRLEIWTCDIHGRHVRTLGHVTQDASAEGDPSLYLDLHWLPSGKQLGFTWDDALYTIPVNHR